MSTKILNSNDELIQGVLNHGPSLLENCVYANSTEIQQYLKKIKIEHLDYPVPVLKTDSTNWFIPQSYKKMDIESFLINACPKENLDRLTIELELFKKHNMFPILRVMKYIVDTLRSNNVVWGVGRGSSVASYALHLLGVHKIDSIKYNLPIEEFFKGDNNG
jgi:DNA polymerase III alpha subunit